MGVAFGWLRYGCLCSQEKTQIANVIAKMDPTSEATVKSSAISTSKFDSKGGWMGLEESPHCPFDVREACRTGDLDTGSGGWESSCPKAWPSPIRDRQDGSFEQQEVSGRDGSGWLQKGLG